MLLRHAAATTYPSAARFAGITADGCSINTCTLPKRSTFGAYACPARRSCCGRMLLMHATTATVVAAAATAPAAAATSYSSSNFVEMIVEYFSVNTDIIQTINSPNLALTAVPLAQHAASAWCYLHIHKVRWHNKLRVPRQHVKAWHLRPPSLLRTHPQGLSI